MRTLLITRGLATVAVVLGHTIGWVYLGQSWWLNRYQAIASSGFVDQVGSPTYHVLFATLQLTLWDVPAFLFASGFFASYAARSGKGVSRTMVKKWIGVFFWPFVIWVTALAIVSWLPLVLLGRNEPPPFIDEFAGAVRLAYFVPLVCQFYLLTPLIARLARTRGRWLLLGAGLLQFGTTGLWYLGQSDIEMGALGRFVGASEFFFWKWAIYFPLGAVCGFHFKQLRTWLKKHVRALLAATIILGALSVAEMMVFSRSVQGLQATHYTVSAIGYAIAMILLLLAVSERWIPSQVQLSDIGTRSLGIYLSHVIVLVTIARAVYHTIPALMFQPVLFLLVLFLPALGLPLLLGAVLSRYARKTLYRYLFG